MSSASGHAVELVVGEPGVERQRERPLEGGVGARERALAPVGAEALQRVRADLALDPLRAKPRQHLVAAVDLDDVGLEPWRSPGVRPGQHDVEAGKPLGVAGGDALVRRVQLVEPAELRDPERAQDV